MLRSRAGRLPAFSLLLFAAGRAVAFVGEPTSMTVTVKQGATTLASQTVTMGTPGSDLPHIQITDPLAPSYVQIGTVGAGSPMIMKVVTEGDPVFRILHMYIDVPISTSNIDAPGPTSLFDPADPSPISIQVTNASFSDGGSVTPLIVNNNSFFTLFMRDMAGRFYELPQANASNSYGHGVIDVQVPGEAFMDGVANPYSFTSVSGIMSSWAWNNIVNPGPTTPVNDGSGSIPSAGAGYVFEIGLAVAFVPEPGTIAFCGSAIAFFAFRRSRRRIGPHV
jgi:hypothetical protein